MAMLAGLVAHLPDIDLNGRDLGFCEKRQPIALKRAIKTRDRGDHRLF